jgi:hypothetical protein
MSQRNPFKWRHFEAEIILLCVRWYLRYALSYRDLEEMMLERGLSVDHTTLYRWVQHYAPELDKRCPFRTAWRTLRGFEVMHMIRKGQLHGIKRGDIIAQNLIIATVFGIAA